MEVNKYNWLEFIEEFEQLYTDAIGISIDTEFGSAIMPGHKPNILEDIEYKYEHIRKVCATFAISEVGITLIFPAMTDDRTYYTKSWSIPCVPSHRMGVFHLWTTDTLDLVHDIPRWKRKAIPYMSISYIHYIQYELQNVPFRRINADVHHKMHKRYIPIIRSLGKCNEQFVKLPEMNEDELQIVASMCADTWIIAMRDVEYSSHNDIIPKYAAFRDGRLLDPHHFAMFRGGIGSIMDILLRKPRDIPIITHNGILDIAFLWNHCVETLHCNRCEFIEQVHESFPLLFDTKYNMIKYSSVDDMIMRGTDLTTCYHSSMHRMSHIKVINTQREGNLHEAWWDSYMTAHIYLFLKHSSIPEYIPIYNRFHMILCIENWCWTGERDYQKLYVYILQLHNHNSVSIEQLRRSIHILHPHASRPYIDITNIGLVVLTWKENISSVIRVLYPLGRLVSFHVPVLA